MTETQKSKSQSFGEEKGQSRYQLIIFVAAFSAFIATFNETFLNVSFAAVMADFHVSVGMVQWLAAAYMLGAAVMVPVSAFAYKSILTKKLYLFTVGLLIVGSIIGAVSSCFSVLLIGRIVQALGTGMLIPIGMNITLEAAPKEKLGTYMGIMGAMTTLGPSSSVIIAGALLEFFDWHVLLWFFGGLSLLCFLCGAVLLPNIAKLTHPKLDVCSVIFISLALIGILYGISTVLAGNVTIAILAAVIGIIFLILFVKRQNTLSEPLIQLSPLKIRAFSIGVIINMISLLVIFAMNIVMPLFMQSGMGCPRSMLPWYYSLLFCYPASLRPLQDEFTTKKAEKYCCLWAFSVSVSAPPHFPWFIQNIRFCWQFYTFLSSAAAR